MLRRLGKIVMAGIILMAVSSPTEGPPLVEGIGESLALSYEDTSNLPRLWVPVVNGGTVMRTVMKGGARPSCPENMSDMGGYCIDKQPIPAPANWYAAADSCQASGKRLCSNEEWLQACDASPLNGVSAMPEGGPEWLSNWVFDTSDQVFDSLDHGYFRCRTSSQPRPTSRPFEIRKFRCCL